MAEQVSTGLFGIPSKQVPALARRSYRIVLLIPVITLVVLVVAGTVVQHTVVGIPIYLLMIVGAAVGIAGPIIYAHEAKWRVALAWVGLGFVQWGVTSLQQNYADTWQAVRVADAYLVPEWLHQILPLSHIPIATASPMGVGYWILIAIVCHAIWQARRRISTGDDLPTASGSPLAGPDRGHLLVAVMVVLVAGFEAMMFPYSPFIRLEPHAANSGVQANSHTVRWAIEKYAAAHGGRYPRDATEATQVLLQKGAGYLAGDALPRSPWGARQTALGHADDAALRFELEWNTGRSQRVSDPQTIYQLGALLYRGRPDGKGFSLLGVGKSHSNALLIYRVDTNMPSRPKGRRR